MIQSLAEKAGRHLLQLMTLLKENMLARVALFTVICALIFLAFTVILTLKRIPCSVYYSGGGNETMSVVSS